VDIKELTSGLGADIVVEATGANENLSLAQRLVRPMGVIAVKSTSGLPVHDLDTTKTAVDEIRIQGTRCGPFDKAIAFMQEHGIPNRAWITSRFPLAEAQAALEAAGTEAKVVLEI
jgi:alcohol dehydrogenase